MPADFYIIYIAGMLSRPEVFAYVFEGHTDRAKLCG